MKKISERYCYSLCQSVNQKLVSVTVRYILTARYLKIPPHPRMMKERILSLLDRQLARCDSSGRLKEDTEADSQPQDDEDVGDESGAFLQVQDFLEDVADAQEKRNFFYQIFPKFSWI